MFDVAAPILTRLFVPGVQVAGVGVAPSSEPPPRRCLRGKGPTSAACPIRGAWGKRRCGGGSRSAGRRERLGESRMGDAPVKSRSACVDRNACVATHRIRRRLGTRPRSRLCRSRVERLTRLGIFITHAFYNLGPSDADPGTTRKSRPTRVRSVVLARVSWHAVPSKTAICPGRMSNGSKSSAPGEDSMCRLFAPKVRVRPTQPFMDPSRDPLTDFCLAKEKTHEFFL